MEPKIRISGQFFVAGVVKRCYGPINSSFFGVRFVGSADFVMFAPRILPSQIFANASQPH